MSALLTTALPVHQGGYRLGDKTNLRVRLGHVGNCIACGKQTKYGERFMFEGRVLEDPFCARCWIDHLARELYVVEGGAA